MLHLQKCVKVHFHWRMTSFKFNTIWNEIWMLWQTKTQSWTQSRTGSWRSGTRGTTQNSFTRWHKDPTETSAWLLSEQTSNVFSCRTLHSQKNNTKLAPTALFMVSPLKPWLQSVVDSDSRRRHGRLVSPVSFLHFHQLGCKRSWCIGNSHRNLQARPRDDVYVTQTLADGQSFNISRRAGDLLGAVVLATSTLSESRRCCRMEVKQVKRPLQK